MGIYERIFHSVLYEISSVAFAALVLLAFTDHRIGAVSGAMLAVITASMLWNFVFNILFDRIVKGRRELRGPRIRLVHTLLFEGGLVLLTTPILAYMLDLTLVQAFVTDIGITLAVMAYTYVFNWAYDHTRLLFVRHHGQPAAR
ncbi:Predicted membrane protein [Kingella potus]|uniref:Predicted membrane protein n=1 Tax=Kingella potus TaxID=265175 RepID=A0A377R494_9NEIS|nr:PACE efflux transporter [Kingella potus]UOO99893.1 PACE efflux transporter [Kingella potus]STR03153.1 Predicted membrane protein [Kingella potus]